METKNIKYHPIHPALRPYLFGILHCRIKKNDEKILTNLYPTDYAILCFDRHKKHFTDAYKQNKYNYTSCYLGLTEFRRSFSESTEEVFQVIFKPFGVYAIFGLPQHELSNRITDGDMVFPDTMSIQTFLEYESDPGACLRQIERWLLHHLSRRQNIHKEPLMRACNKIYQSRGKIFLKHLSREVGMSERNLRYYFHEQVGVGPKTFIRLVRFNFINRFLAPSSVVDWNEIAYLFGFFDQNHFIKEFKWFYGITPRMYTKITQFNLSEQITRSFSV